MGADFILVTCIFVDVRRHQNRVTLFARRQWNRPLHLRPRSLCCVDNLFRRNIDQTMIKGFQANADTLILHGQTPPNLSKPKQRRFAAQNRRFRTFLLLKNWTTKKCPRVPFSKAALKR